MIKGFFKTDGAFHEAMGLIGAVAIWKLGNAFNAPNGAENIAAISCCLSTLFLSPDLDLPGWGEDDWKCKCHHRWRRIFGSEKVWNVYADLPFVSHRSPASHLPILGDAIRLPFGVIAIALGVPHAVFRMLRNAYRNVKREPMAFAVHWFAIWLAVHGFFMSVDASMKEGVIAIAVGMVAASTIHLACDNFKLWRK